MDLKVIRHNIEWLSMFMHRIHHRARTRENHRIISSNYFVFNLSFPNFYKSINLVLIEHFMHKMISWQTKIINIGNSMQTHSLNVWVEILIPFSIDFDKRMEYTHILASPIDDRVHELCEQHFTLQKWFWKLRTKILERLFYSSSFKPHFKI